MQNSIKTLLLFFVTSMAVYSGTYSSNDGGNRDGLLSILPDLRVFIDLDSNEMPWYYSSGLKKTYLAPDDVKGAVKIALGNWASILPAFNFRFVNTKNEANFRLLFRDTFTDETYTGGTWTAISMLPSSVVASPDFNRDNEGIYENTIRIRTPLLVFRKADFISSKIWYEYKSSIYSREGNRRLFHFEYMPDQKFLPQGITYPFELIVPVKSQPGTYVRCKYETRHKYIVYETYTATDTVSTIDTATAPAHWPGDIDRTNPFYYRYANWVDTSRISHRFLAVKGVPDDSGDYPFFIEEYLTVEDRGMADHSDIFGLTGFTDLVALTQHEFGHTLLGDHGPVVNQRSVYQPKDWIVFDEYNAIAKSTLNSPATLPSITAQTSPSNLYGTDFFYALGQWNMRGVWDVDADRLASGNNSTSEWKGYSGVTYPETEWTIELKTQAGEVYYTSNWHEAHKKMAWPLHRNTPDNTAAHATVWFQTNIYQPGEIPPEQNVLSCRIKRHMSY